jgi:hypothetical protein
MIVKLSSNTPLQIDWNDMGGDGDDDSTSTAKSTP